MSSTSASTSTAALHHAVQTEEAYVHVCRLLRLDSSSLLHSFALICSAAHSMESTFLSVDTLDALMLLLKLMGNVDCNGADNTIIQETIILLKSLKLNRCKNQNTTICYFISLLLCRFADSIVMSDLIGDHDMSTSELSRIVAQQACLLQTQLRVDMLVPNNKKLAAMNSSSWTVLHSMTALEQLLAIRNLLGSGLEYELQCLLSYYDTRNGVVWDLDDDDLLAIKSGDGLLLIDIVKSLIPRYNYLGGNSLLQHNRFISNLLTIPSFLREWIAANGIEATLLSCVGNQNRSSTEIIDCFRFVMQVIELALYDPSVTSSSVCGRVISQTMFLGIIGASDTEDLGVVVYSVSLLWLCYRSASTLPDDVQSQLLSQLSITASIGLSRLLKGDYCSVFDSLMISTKRIVFFVESCVSVLGLSLSFSSDASSVISCCPFFTKAMEVFPCSRQVVCLCASLLLVLISDYDAIKVVIHADSLKALSVIDKSVLNPSSDSSSDSSSDPTSDVYQCALAVSEVCSYLVADDIGEEWFQNCDDRLVISGIIEVMLWCINNNKYDEQLLDFATSALWSICCIEFKHFRSDDDDPAAMAIGTNNGVPLLISVLINYPLSLSLTQNCLSTLWSSVVGSKLCRVALMETDGIPAIVDAMNRYGADEIVQNSSCAIIWVTASGSDLSSVSDRYNRRVSIVDAGTIPVTLYAMSMFEDNEQLAINACGVLWYSICDDTEALTLMIQRIGKTIQNHIQSCQVLINAFGALTALGTTKNHAINIQSLCETCGITSVLSECVTRALAPGVYFDLTLPRIALSALVSTAQPLVQVVKYLSLRANGDPLPFQINVAPSTIQHANAGKGVFISSNVGVGTVVALYPGTVYYPTSGVFNEYVISTPGQCEINASTDVNSIKKFEELSIAMGGRSHSWIYSNGGVSHWDAAHMVNHAPPGIFPNVQFVSFQYPSNLSEENLHIIPNVCENKNREMLDGMLLMSTRALKAGEELFADYAYPPMMEETTKSWYHPCRVSYGRLAWGVETN